MAKKDLNKNKMTDKEIQDNKDILAELENIDKLLGEDIDVVSVPSTPKAPKEPKQPKAQAPKKDTTGTDNKVEIKITADPEVVKAILAKLPDTIQTKHLNEVFEFNDGGKYMRRHLRSKFSQGHEHGQPWIWTKEDKQLLQIVEYFVSTLTNEKKQQLVCVGEDIING